MSVRLTISLADDVHAALVEKAEFEQRSLSWLVNYMVQHSVMATSSSYVALGPAPKRSPVRTLGGKEPSGGIRDGVQAAGAVSGSPASSSPPSPDPGLAAMTLKSGATPKAFVKMLESETAVLGKGDSAVEPASTGSRADGGASGSSLPSVPVLGEGDSGGPPSGSSSPSTGPVGDIFEKLLADREPEKCERALYHRKGEFCKACNEMIA